MTVSQICDYIILVAALCVAIKNIYEFFAKPTSKIKTRYMKELYEHIGRYFDEKLPIVLQKHDDKASQERIQREQEYFEEEKETVLTETRTMFEQILQENKVQSENIEKLGSTTKDMLRQRIMAIYHSNVKTRTLTVNERESLDELYKDYKEQKGNSYIDKYWRRMESWEITPDEYDD